MLADKTSRIKGDFCPVPKQSWKIRFKRSREFTTIFQIRHNETEDYSLCHVVKALKCHVYLKPKFKCKQYRMKNVWLMI